MSTKFFNNTPGNTLFDKLKGIASEMATFDRFLAVVGFFRSSGYFKLRKELGDISEMKILVGINIDDIFRKHNKALLMLADADKAKEIFMKKFPRVLALILALVMVFSLVTVGFAGFKDEAQLQFDENGNFKIMVLADVQTDYPVPDDMITFIREALTNGNITY
mgnify:CR=1 FL=1